MTRNSQRHVNFVILDNKNFQFNDTKTIYFATSVLLIFSGEKSQKKAETTDFRMHFKCFQNSGGWMLLTVNDVNKTKYDTN